MDNGGEPATKADRKELRQDIDLQRRDIDLLRQDFGLQRQDIDTLRAERRQDVDMLRSEFQHGFDDLKETLRDVQTEILKAFYSFTTSNQPTTYPARGQ